LGFFFSHEYDVTAKGPKIDTNVCPYLPLLLGVKTENIASNRNNLDINFATSPS